MDIGKKIRLERILDRNTGNAIIVPMDQGMAFGPVPGLNDLVDAVNEVTAGGATAVMMHKGMVCRGHRGSGHDVGLILHLSASTSHAPDPSLERRVSSVEEAVRMGADAVSVRLAIGVEGEQDMLASLGAVSEECGYWGMPLVAMATPSWKGAGKYDPEAIAHCARVVAELGADIVRVDYTGDQDSFREVVIGAGVPVVITGGPKMGSDEEILTTVHDAMEAGCHGVSIGRNVFQHKDVQGMTRAVSEIVMLGSDVEESMKYL